NTGCRSPQGLSSGSSFKRKNGKVVDGIASNHLTLQEITIMSNAPFLKMLVAPIIAALVLTAGWAQQDLDPNTVMVTVNGAPITHKQVQGEIGALSAGGYTPPIEEVFSQLIARELLYQAALENNLVA